MHLVFDDNKRLLFKYEILRSRLSIRDFFLKTLVKEIYENIGQVLSLVRIQLAVIEPSNYQNNIEELNNPGLLVGQSISELRNLCRNFYPDLDLITKGDSIERLVHTIHVLQLHPDPVVKIKGEPKHVSEDLTILVFSILQDSLSKIKEVGGKLKQLRVTHREDYSIVDLSYNGELVELDKKNDLKDPYEFSIKERAELIEGNIKINKNKNGICHITLKHPYKLPYYE